MIEQLKKNIEDRQQYLRADRNQYTVCLKEVDPEWLVRQTFPHVMKGIEKHSTLVDIAVTVGRRIRQKLKMKRDGVSSCQVGFFILVAFFETGLIEYRLKRVKKKNGKASKFRTYDISIKNRKALFEMWDVIRDDPSVDLYPMKDPIEPWTSGLHPSGVGVVKKSSMEFLKKFNQEEHGMIFTALNKLGSTPWMVNKPILDVVKHYMQEPEEGNPLKYKKEKDPDKKQSLYVVVSSCIRIAENNLDNNMYDLYNLDFR